MNYKQTLEYLLARLPMYQRIGAAAYKADLTNTINLCNLLGNPQNSFRSIHIAGTNGKGSTSHLVASVLQEAGLKVGLYTSPHLRDFRERIRINGKMITKQYVSRFVDRHRPEFEQMDLSFFEMTVGLAFSYFRDQEIDIGVIEVGMGGRLDSTNVITPIVSVITNISFDHKQFLGDTLGKIAGEKAGIIKPGIPVIIGETQDQVRDVFVQKAAQSGSGIQFADAAWSTYDHYKSGPCSRMSSRSNRFLVLDIFRGKGIFLKNLLCPLMGKYQRKNIITVMATLEVLEKSGIAVSLKNIRKGVYRVIRNTHLRGRWQVLSKRPLTVCDTGHNEGGIREVIKQVNLVKHARLHFVFGVVNDKSIDEILHLLPPEATYYFCKADIPRGLDAGVLQSKALEAGLKGESYESVRKALKAARKNAADDDLILVGGSTFVVAEVV
jgi:dihydrofolate synthase / folylpolyglutamate synthase